MCGVKGQCQTVFGFDAEGLTDSIRVEAAVGEIVDGLVQMAMNNQLNVEGDLQVVERLPAARMTPELLVAHEDVGALTRGALVLVRKDRRC